MKLYTRDQVNVCDGYWHRKQEMNRQTTLYRVYDRFEETGRFAAFDMKYKPGDEIVPHIFWDSDVAKWLEGAAYSIQKHPDKDLEEKIEQTVQKIRKHQGEDGYFNIYYTVVEPEKRFTDRDKHELYCAGHLMEAAVAYAQATGKEEFLDCMEKYTDYIIRVFVEEKSAAFRTPGHEEIELALLKMYDYTGKKKFLDLAKYFVDVRGTIEEKGKDYNQSFLPVREQTEAKGHAVRAMYLYTAMAGVAQRTGDESLKQACRTLWEDVTRRKMYVTGGLGSSYVGEAFYVPYDLPNDTAYAETCAAIGLMFFAQAMLGLENRAEYADIAERAFYNGVLAGISQKGDAFFYENPLEINLAQRQHSFISMRTGLKTERRLPITQRLACFKCSCCPPNIARLLASLDDYIYGREGDVVYVNQFASSELSDGALFVEQTTQYPNDGTVRIQAEGVKTLAVRIPAWCENFRIDRAYQMENGYAMIENCEGEIKIELDMPAKMIWADPNVVTDVGRVCVTRGPIVYCAEKVDNEGLPHSYVLTKDTEFETEYDEEWDLCRLRATCLRELPFEGESLYRNSAPAREKATLNLVPYQTFANRGESDMCVWLRYC